MTQLSTIEINKEDIKFSAAHFTIFSATERERLHGHNFRVSVAVTAKVGDDGLCFSYKEIKDQLRALCVEWDEYTLLPGNSPHLRVWEDNNYVKAQFGDDVMSFLASDCLVLPIRNTSVEEFSRLMLSRLLENSQFLETAGVRCLTVSVATGPGQKGSTTWTL